METQESRNMGCTDKHDYVQRTITSGQFLSACELIGKCHGNEFCFRSSHSLSSQSLLQYMHHLVFRLSCCANCKLWNRCFPGSDREEPLLKRFAGWGKQFATLNHCRELATSQGSIRNHDFSQRLSSFLGAASAWQVHPALVWRGSGGVDHVHVVFSSAAARRIRVRALAPAA